MYDPYQPGDGKKFYEEQLALIAAGDIDKFLEAHYCEDAVMVTFDGIRRGREELKEYYVNRFTSIGQVTYLENKFFAETEDSIIFKAVMRSSNQAEGEVYADNAFVMKNGKIWRHLALTVLPIYEAKGLYDEWGTRWTD